MKRTGFIGGSDCVKIMQGDWYDLWQIKTGKITSPDLNDNLAVRMGSYTESFNMQWFEENMPKRDMNDYLVHNQQYEYERNVDGVPMKGTIDGMCRDSIVECKEGFEILDILILRSLRVALFGLHIFDLCHEIVSINLFPKS